MTRQRNGWKRILIKIKAKCEECEAGGKDLFPCPNCNKMLCAECLLDDSRHSCLLTKTEKEERE